MHQSSIWGCPAGCLDGRSDVCLDPRVCRSLGSRCPCKLPNLPRYDAYFFQICRDKAHLQVFSCVRAVFASQCSMSNAAYVIVGNICYSVTDGNVVATQTTLCWQAASRIWMIQAVKI